MSNEAHTPGWSSLDDSLKMLQVAEAVLAAAKERVDSMRRTILKTIEDGGGTTFHGSVGTVSLVTTRKVVVDEAQKEAIIDAYKSSVYVARIPEHYELTPVFMDHARDGAFAPYGIEVVESRGIRVNYAGTKKEKSGG